MSELKLYAEVGEDKGCLLFTIEPPGLLVRGSSIEEALRLAPQAARELDDFLSGCGQPYVSFGPAPDIVVAETKKRRGKVANGNTSVTFAADLVPVQADDIPRFLTVQEHLRKELMQLKEVIPEAAYSFASMPQRMSILKQLTHLADCDHWYLSRLWSNLPRLSKSRDVWEKLSMNRERVTQVLLNLTSADLALEKRVNGETWTCRKMLRRFMYHERFHLDTIKRDLDLFFNSQRR